MRMIRWPKATRGSIRWLESGRAKSYTPILRYSLPIPRLSYGPDDYQSPLVMIGEPTLKFGDLPSKLPLLGNRATKSYKCSHNEHTHFNRTLRVENRCSHDCPMLSECIRHFYRKLRLPEVGTICDNLRSQPLRPNYALYGFQVKACRLPVFQITLKYEYHMIMSISSTWDTLAHPDKLYRIEGLFD
jgi:hypothetical protein